LDKAGFRLEHSTHIFWFLPIPILLFRTIPSWFGLAKSVHKPQDISREHGTSGTLIPRLASAVLDPEIRRLEKGREMGFGGSCLIAGTVR
jgi:hypothetical protein